MSDQHEYKSGDSVKWKWGNGYGHGKIQSVFAEKTSRTIDSNDVTRNGSEANPALYIVVDDGNNVLKLASEVDQDN